ncbi:MAG: hypothetical protein QM501_11230 [Gimesia sp.]
MRQYIVLREYQQFIHHHYTTEINLLQSSVLEWPEDQFKDEEAYQSVEAIEAKLNETFSVGDFYCANWSYDSHHGARGTGLPDGGFTRYPVFSTTDKSRQSLYFGRSFAGDDLLIFQIWLPSAPLMKHFQLVLYRDAVDSRM